MTQIRMEGGERRGYSSCTAHFTKPPPLSVVLIGPALGHWENVRSTEDDVKFGVRLVVSLTPIAHICLAKGPIPPCQPPKPSPTPINIFCLYDSLCPSLSLTHTHTQRTHILALPPIISLSLAHTHTYTRTHTHLFMCTLAHLSLHIDQS